jgi:hypothetical protein
MSPLSRYPVLALLMSLIIGIAASGCRTGTGQIGTPLPTVSQSEIADLEIVSGQLVFVPAYSRMFYGDERHVAHLTTTLAIHNTDLENPIIIRSVRYYDTDGALVREFIEQPVQLSPLGTVGFVVAPLDETGGLGANFLIEWGAPTPVYEPVIEAVMVNTSIGGGVSVISPGRVLSEERLPS